MAATYPLMARTGIAAQAVSLIGLLAAAPAPPAVAAGDGSLTLLRGKAGCLSATTWRYKPGCARIRGLRRPGDVAVSPDGRNVYASSPISNTIAVFGRGARTGALRQLRGRTGCLNPTGRYGCGRARGLRNASGIEVSGDGRNVYVQSTEALAVFRRDRRTGALRQLPGKAGCVGDRPRERSRQGCAAGRALAAQFDLTLSPSGRFLYVASGWYVESAPSQGGIAVFRRDPRTGRLAQLPGAAGCVTALGRQHCGQARSMPRRGANQVVLDRGGGNLYAAASGTFTGVIVFDRLRGGGLRQLRGSAGCVSGGGAGGCTPARALEALHGLAASPAGIDNLYASTSFSVFPGVRHGSVFNLVRDSATGALSQPAGPVGCVSWDGGGDGCASTHSQMNAAGAVAVSRDGRNVYAPLISELGGAGMVVFARNRATGELFQLPGPAGCLAHPPTPDCTDDGGLAATAIALSPDGRNAYVTSGSGSPSGTGLPPYYALAVYTRAR